MSITIQEIGPDRFAQYGGIPSRFEVRSILRVEVMGTGLGGFRLVGRADLMSAAGESCWGPATLGSLWPGRRLPSSRRSFP